MTELVFDRKAWLERAKIACASYLRVDVRSISNVGLIAHSAHREWIGFRVTMDDGQTDITTPGTVEEFVDEFCPPIIVESRGE